MHVHKTHAQTLFIVIPVNDKTRLKGVTPVCFVITAIAFIHVVRGDFDGIVRSRRWRASAKSPSLRITWYGILQEGKARIDERPGA